MSVRFIRLLPVVLLALFALAACDDGGDGPAASAPDDGASDTADASEDAGAADATGDGTVTVDGTSYAVDETRRCAGPAEAQELIEELGIETLGLVALVGDGTTLQVYTSTIGDHITLDLSWRPSGEPSFTLGAVDYGGDGQWTGGDGEGDLMEVAPLEVAGDRAFGTATLESDAGDGSVDVSFDLPIPQEATC